MEVKLYSSKKNNLKSVELKPFKTEKEIQNLAVAKDWEWKSGVKGNVYQLELNKSSDIDYHLFLINQKIKNLSI